MPLIKEDGSAKPDANSYASVAESDAYHEAHLYATVWTVATPETKEKALLMATRLLDGQYQFLGFRATSTQALQWPRQNCPDPDQQRATWTLGSADGYIPSNTLPQALVQATCEMARELLLADRTAPPPGEGLSSTWDSYSGTKYDKTDTRPILSHVTQALLAKYGTLLTARSAQVRLIRV